MHDLDCLVNQLQSYKTDQNQAVGNITDRIDDLAKAKVSFHLMVKSTHFNRKQQPGTSADSSDMVLKVGHYPLTQ